MDEINKNQASSGRLFHNILEDCDRISGSLRSIDNDTLDDDGRQKLSTVLDSIFEALQAIQHKLGQYQHKLGGHGNQSWETIPEIKEEVADLEDQLEDCVAPLHQFQRTIEYESTAAEQSTSTSRAGSPGVCALPRVEQNRSQDGSKDGEKVENTNLPDDEVLERLYPRPGKTRIPLRLLPQIGISFCHIDYPHHLEVS